MLGKYSLIWTICHKLMWFYRNAVSFNIIFVVTHDEIFSHLGHTGPLTVNKMALPSMYRRIWRHSHAFIARNTIALRVQKFAVGANIICLTYATDWWAVIGPVIHGESKFKRNIIVLCICRHDMVAIMMSNPGLSNKYDVDLMSNSDSKRSNTLFRAGGWSLSPVSEWRVFLVPF